MYRARRLAISQKAGDGNRQRGAKIRFDVALLRRLAPVGWTQATRGTTLHR